MNQPKKKFEFSKLIMCAVMLTYFITIAFAMYVIYNMMKESHASIGTCFNAFLIFVATPVSVSLGFYSNKSKAENIEKIRGAMNTVENVIFDRVDDDCSAD